VAEGAARVLAALRDAGSEARSGQALSDELGVSRAQIWKHVEGLRRRGYEIAGEPGGGYRLAGTPDRLYSEEILATLDTHWLARDYHYFETIDSTNREAFELARKGAPHGSTVVAEQQTAGRGRLGRAFFSPAHLNLYASIVLRPELDTAAAPTLIPTAGVAVAEAIAQTVEDPEEVELKWPNDVLLGGLKTSGILMEMSAEATRVDFAVLGIGVNLNVAREDLPDEFRARATSLFSHMGRPVDRVAFARRLFSTLEQVLDEHARGGFGALRRRYDALFKMRGREVRVLELGGHAITGRAHGIAEDGALEVERDDGEIVRVIAGDVTLASSLP